MERVLYYLWCRANDLHPLTINGWLAPASAASPSYLDRNAQFPTLESFMEPTIAFALISDADVTSDSSHTNRLPRVIGESTFDLLWDLFVAPSGPRLRYPLPINMHLSSLSLQSFSFAL